MAQERPWTYLIAPLSKIEQRTLKPMALLKLQRMGQGAQTAHVRRGAIYGTKHLVPNRQGLDAAIAASVDEIAVFASASEEFSRKNINCSVEESLERLRRHKWPLWSTACWNAAVLKSALVTSSAPPLRNSQIC